MAGDGRLTGDPPLQTGRLALPGYERSGCG
jgi:hypothetical protein